MEITQPKKTKPLPTELPTDLLRIILSNLPVKSIVRFLSVSKTWKSVIEDPEFAKFYKNRFKLQTYVIGSKASGETECAVTFRENFTVNPNYATLSVAAEDDFRSDIPKRVWKVIGYVDGLFILRKKGSSNGEHWRDVIMCWNPSIRRFRVLPHPPADIEDKISLYSGLGFDPSIKDYKYIRNIIHPSTKTASILIYTFRTDSWKRVEFKSRGQTDIPWHFCLSEDGQSVCCQGSLYWTINSKKSWWLVSFNLNMEEFSASKLPVVLDDGNWVLRCSHDGRSLHAAFISEYKVTIWSGKGGGGDVAWRRFYEFDLSFPIGSDGILCYPEDVISMDFEMGLVLIGCQRYVVCYDLVTQQKIRVPMKDGNRDFARVDPYVESLALLN